MGQPTVEQMVARAADIHGRNVAAGWWTDLQTGESLKGKRSPLELLAMVHSELSEALEGDRKNLMDDKLPHRSMFEVELADAVIRAYDIAGGFDLEARFPRGDQALNAIWAKALFRSLNPQSRSEYIAVLHLMVGQITRAFDDLPAPIDDREAFKSGNLCDFIRAIHLVAERFGLDLDGAIDEKLAYNLTRADHKPENRKLAGGKAY